MKLDGSLDRAYVLIKVSFTCYQGFFEFFGIPNLGMGVAGVIPESCRVCLARYLRFYSYCDPNSGQFSYPLPNMVHPLYAPITILHSLS